MPTVGLLSGVVAEGVASGGVAIPAREGDNMSISGSHSTILFWLRMAYASRANASIVGGGPDVSLSWADGMGGSGAAARSPALSCCSSGTEV